VRLDPDAFTRVCGDDTEERSIDSDAYVRLLRTEFGIDLP
jgi:hypothetical protein